MYIRHATRLDLEDVADACHLLHEMENCPVTGIGAERGRVLEHLLHLSLSQTGIVLVAKEKRAFLGCVVLELDVIPQPGSALASCLFTDPSAPLRTAILLMTAAADVCRRLGRSSVWMTAATGKNSRRKTYERMGFRDMEMSIDNAHLFKASLADISAALSRRSGNLKQWLQGKEQI